MRQMRRELAAHMRELREHHKLTQAELAVALGVSRQSVMRAEDSEIGIPRRRFFRALASLSANVLSGRTRQLVEWGLHERTQTPVPVRAENLEAGTVVSAGWVRKELAGHLKILREHFRVTQIEFGAMLGVSERTVKRAECPHSKTVPSLVFFRSLGSLPESPFSTDTQELLRRGFSLDIRRRRRQA